MPMNEELINLMQEKLREVETAYGTTQATIRDSNAIIKGLKDNLDILGRLARSLNESIESMCSPDTNPEAVAVNGSHAQEAADARLDRETER